jgi:DNA-binding MarR family transcriptional regulator
VDSLLASWAQARPDLDMAPVGVISRLSLVRSYLDDELAAVYARFGLTAPDFAVLVTLARLEHQRTKVSQRRLADELGLTSGTISVRVDRLSDQGLVHRDPDPDSRRNVLLSLTQDGRARFEQVVPAHLANEARLIAALSDDERNLLADLLRKLLVEFQGSDGTHGAEATLGVLLEPAHITMTMRKSVGLTGRPGLLVRDVDPGSPAARAGVVSGDVLVEAGGRALHSSSALYAAIEEAGKALVVRYLRGDVEGTARVRLPAGRNIVGRAATSPSADGDGKHRL